MRLVQAASASTAVVAVVCAIFIWPSDGFNPTFSAGAKRASQQPWICPSPACNAFGNTRRKGGVWMTEVEASAGAHRAAGAPAEVALTREAGKNGKLATLLNDAGISTVEVPCIAHEDGPDLHLLPDALVDPSLTYIVITSPEAAKVFLSGWGDAGKPPVSVACVGKATGDTLAKGGVTPVFTPSKATGDTLAAEIPLPSPVEEEEASDSNKRDGHVGENAVEHDAKALSSSEEQERRDPRPLVLYPASARAQKTLESGLVARGFEVRRLNTYDTVPANWDEETRIRAAGATVAAFGSPSAVKTWASRLGVAREDGKKGDQEGGAGVGGAFAACIGETSARACRQAGWPESTIFSPEKPGMDGWATAVGDALAAIQASSPNTVDSVAR